MDFLTDIHVPQRVTSNDFNDSPTFPLAPHFSLIQCNIQPSIGSKFGGVTVCVCVTIVIIFNVLIVTISSEHCCAFVQFHIHCGCGLGHNTDHYHLCI